MAVFQLNDSLLKENILNSPQCQLYYYNLYDFSIVNIDRMKDLIHPLKPRPNY